MVTRKRDCRFQKLILRKNAVGRLLEKTEAPAGLAARLRRHRWTLKAVQN